MSKIAWENQEFRSVIIIGAPRSGTNMLRDMLTEIPGVGTWPCDEINYIWRHGNVRYPTDEFTAEMATPPIQRYIGRAFDRLAKRQDLNVVAEKTCANSLRVPFVDRISPKARYIFIYRDGMDAVGSAVKRWKAELDIPYLMRKARYVPPSDLPYYACRYVWNRFYRLLSREERLAFWGPLFSGYKDALQKYSLAEVCALQWKHCVDLSEQAFAEIEPERILRVKYEDFVTDSFNELDRICSALGLQMDSEQLRAATAKVTECSVGKGRRSLSPEIMEKIRPHIQDSLERYGYA